MTSLGTTLQAYSQTNLGGNPTSFNAAQFVLDNGIFQPLASLTLNNANSGVTINPGGGTFNIASGLTLTIAIPITGTGGLTNQGTGVLVFSGTNTFTGPTVINAGTLVLAGHGSIANCPDITLAGGAALDVSSLSAAFILSSNQSLSNSAAGAILNGTNNTASGTLSLLYNGISPAMISTNGAMTLAGTTLLKINNIGGQLAIGSSNKILARASTGNTGLITGTVPASVIVSGNGAAGPVALRLTGGELYLIVNPNIPATGTNITFSGSGNQLTFSWPANYLGWLLQSNPMSLAITNDWFTVPGSANTNRIQITIDPAKPNVFYRMRAP